MRRSTASEDEESIYGLIPPPEASEERRLMYRSKFPADSPPTGSTFGPASTIGIGASNLSGEFTSRPTPHIYFHPHALFGSKKDHESNPKRFLKKNSNIPLPEPTRHRYEDTRKPALDNKFDADSQIAARLTGQLTSPKKNFISSNALAVIMAQAADRRPNNAESASCFDKPGFGKVPAYISKVKEDIASEREFIKGVLSATKEEEIKNKPKLVLLPESERLELIDRLKDQWEVANKQYQVITHAVTLDSVAKKRRKEEYEIQLNEIEKSIEKLGKKYVYIQSNN